MSNMTFTPSRLLVLALGTLASSAAFAWGDAAVTAWTARNANLVAAVNQPIGAGAPPGADGKPALYVVNSRGFVLGYKQNAEEDAATGASSAWVTNIEEQCKGLTGNTSRTVAATCPRGPRPPRAGSAAA